MQVIMHNAPKVDELKANWDDSICRFIHILNVIRMSPQ